MCVGNLGIMIIELFPFVQKRSTFSSQQDWINLIIDSLTSSLLSKRNHANLFSLLSIRVCQILSHSSQEGLCYVTCGGMHTFLYFTKVTLIQSVCERQESQESEQCYEQIRLKNNLKTTISTPICQIAVLEVCYTQELLQYCVDF